MQRFRSVVPRLLAGGMAVYLFCFLLLSPALASRQMGYALRLCAETVVPSLFPFLVLNTLLLSTGLADSLGRLAGGLPSRLFGIKKEGTVAFFAGCLMGFPLGVKLSAELYKRGKVSKNEAERMVCFCANTGPSFVIGVVGSALNNTYAAIAVYLSQLLSAVAIGLWLSRRKEMDGDNTASADKLTFSLSDIPSAVTSAVLPMLNICAFVCFFACVSLSAENALSWFGVSGTPFLVLSGALELTNGIAMLSNLECGCLAASIAAFFVGWSGLSVILQSVSILAKEGLSCRKLIVYKLFQGGLSAVICFLMCKLLNLY